MPTDAVLHILNASPFTNFHWNQPKETIDRQETHCPSEIRACHECANCLAFVFVTLLYSLENVF